MKISGQFLRFAVVGTIGFFVDSAVLLALTEGLGLSPFLGRAISFSLALTTTWIFNRSWTFNGAAKGKTPAGVASEYLNYWAVQLTGGGVNLAAFAVVVALLGDSSLMQVFAVAVGSVAGMFVNYFGNKALVFGASPVAARFQRWSERVVAIAVAAVILLIPAIANHGPFISFDSEQYYSIGHSIAASAGKAAGIASEQPPPIAASDPAPAIAAQPPSEAAAPSAAEGQTGGNWASAFAGARSPFYSLFLYISSAVTGLWGVAVLQALVCAWLISLLVIEFTGSFRKVVYLGLVLAVTVFTGASYFVAWPMPDIFAGAFLLAALLFLFGQRPNLAERIALILLMVWAATVHSTILPLALATAAAALVLKWRGKAGPKGAVIACGLVALSVVPAVAGNAVYRMAAQKLTGMAVFSPPFLSARVIGDGPGQRFLDEQCGERPAEFEVCRYHGRTFLHHNQFLWGVNGEPAYQSADLRSQMAMSREQVRFVLAVARAYPSEQISASVSNGLRELVNLRLSTEWVTIPQVAASWPNAQILTRAPQIERCVADPRDCARPLYAKAWDLLIMGAFLASLAFGLAYALVVLRRGAGADDRKLAAMIAVTVVALIANGILCGVLSGVHGRYQGRLAWILPLLIFAGLPLILSVLRRKRAPA